MWRAFGQAMAMLEEYAETRVRSDGRQEDRRTGNLVYYAVEHPETRPVEDESLPENHPWRVMPDWDRAVSTRMVLTGTSSVESGASASINLPSRKSTTTLVVVSMSIKCLIV